MRNLSRIIYTASFGVLLCAHSNSSLAVGVGTSASGAGGGMSRGVSSGAASGTMGGRAIGGTTSGVNNTGTSSVTGSYTGTAGTTRPTGSANTSSTSMGGTVTGTSPAAGTSAWNTQNQYWSQNYSSRPYYQSGTSYSTYQPAYNYGVNLYNQNPGVPYNSLNQSQLKTNWTNTNRNSQLSWDQAQSAMRDSYNRMYNGSTTNTSTHQ